MIDQQTADRLAEELLSAIGNAMSDWISSRINALGYDNRELTILAGRALLIEGCSMIGVALECESHETLSASLGAVKKFRLIAARKPEFKTAASIGLGD